MIRSEGPIHAYYLNYELQNWYPVSRGLFFLSIKRNLLSEFFTGGNWKHFPILKLHSKPFPA